MNAGTFRAMVPVITVHVLSFCSQLLGDLEDQFNTLEEGSKNMVTQVMIARQDFILYVFDVVHRQSALQPNTLQNRQPSHGLDNDG
jgi:hypothetical protein